MVSFDDVTCILDGVMTTCPHATIDNKALVALLSMMPQTGRQTIIRKSLGFLCRDGPPRYFGFAYKGSYRLLSLLK